MKPSMSSPRRKIQECDKAGDLETKFDVVQKNTVNYYCSKKNPKMNA